MSKENAAIIPIGNQVPAGNKLVQFVDSVTEEDLDGLREEIARTEGRVRAMKKLEGIVSAALGKETEAKKRGPGVRKAGDKAADTVDDRRKRVGAKLLAGRLNGAQIISQCGISPVVFKEVMTCDHFQNTDLGWALTVAGRKAYSAEQ